MNHQSNPASIMASPQTSFPGLGALYFSDRTFSRTVQTFGFSLFAVIMIRWATRPMPSAVVAIEQSPFDIWLVELGPTVAIVVAALALIVSVRRYHWIKRLLSEGRIIQGTVEELDIYERESSDSDTTPAFQRAKIRSYHATVRYQWQGVTRRARFWMPLSGSNFKIFKNKETDLLVLDSAPTKPLLRPLYLQEFAPRKMKWWKWL